MNWFTRHITGIVDFRTRENRQPFWFWVLLVYGGQMVIGWIITIPIIVGMTQQMISLGQNGGDPDRFKYHPELVFQMMKPAMNQMMTVGIVMAIITFVLLAAAIVRRLHDRDMSGWWATPVFVSSLVSPFLAAAMMPRMFDAMTKIQIKPGTPVNPAFAMGPEFAWIQLVQWLGFLLMVILIVFLALPGTMGPNKYGPDPLKFDPTGL